MTVSEDLMLEHGHKLSLNFDDWMQVQLLIHNPTQKKIEIYSVNWTSKCLPNVETFVQLFVNTNDKIQTKSVLVTCRYVRKIITFTGFSIVSLDLHS
jgi:hypothetical protein